MVKKKALYIDGVCECFDWCHRKDGADAEGGVPEQARPVPTGSKPARLEAQQLGRGKLCNLHWKE